MKAYDSGAYGPNEVTDGARSEDRTGRSASAAPSRYGKQWSSGRRKKRQEGKASTRAKAKAELRTEESGGGSE